MNRHTHPAGDSRAEHAEELAQDARDAASDESDDESDVLEAMNVTTADGFDARAVVLTSAAAMLTESFRCAPRLYAREARAIVDELEARAIEARARAGARRARQALLLEGGAS